MDSYCGTPLSMAPEVLEHREYNYKADIWSLGVITFELLTGDPPFNASSKIELRDTIKKG